MKKAKKVLTSLAIAGMTLTMIPFNALAEGATPTRLAGVTAAQTAIEIADQTGWTGTAILASSSSYGRVDALTVAPLATFLKAPILLTEAGNILNVDTKAELIKLNITKVYVASGTAVISQAVLEELKGMGITVESLGGFDRFATSVNIAQKMVTLGAAVNKAAIVYGWLNQDALSIASIASAQTEPILLTEKETIPANVKAFLTTNTSIAATDVIGGPGVISEAVQAQLPSATRRYGDTAYDTNLVVLKAFDGVLKYDNVFIANGETAIDALAGAPLAAQYEAGIVLTNGAANEGTAYVSSKQTATSVATALGGTAVVPDSVLAAASYQAPDGSSGGGGGGGGGTHTATLNQIAAELVSFKGYLNGSEKASLNEARNNLLSAVQNNTLDSAVNPLLTDQVITAFENKGVTKDEAKAAIIKFIGDLQTIHYADDQAALLAALTTLKTDDEGTFRTLFGNDFKVNEFYSFLIATQNELMSVIKKDHLLDIASLNSSQLKNQLVVWTKEATTNVIKKSTYKVFDNKLTAIGWNIDKLVEAQRQVGGIIDHSNAAEKAVAMSVIRSQVQCRIGGRIINSLTLKQGASKSLYLSVKEVTLGGNLVGLIAWKSSDPEIATVDVAGPAIIAGTKTGTAILTGYRKGVPQVEANELVRIMVTVTAK